MRCQYCGWDVSDSKGNCEKCGKPMVEDDTEPAKVVNESVHERPTTRQPSKGMADFKATVRESSRGKTFATVLEELTECPDCGYKLENGVCPSCGYDSNSKTNDNNNEKPIKMNADGKKTVRPHRKSEKDGRFILTPISEDTGQPEGDFIQFDGNEVELNRENTDPKNDTITSQQQAIISREDGKWNILDQSEYKTTFVQAARKIELQNGDLILLGNQLYKFDSLSE